MRGSSSAAPPQGRLILLTGVSGSGKTTLGRLLVEELQRVGARPAVLVDGDVTRSFFEGGLGYDAEAREEATRRMAFGAYTLVRQNHDVVLANIAGTEAVRAFLRKKFPDLVEVFLDAPLPAVVANDPKGIYATALGRPEPQLVGFDQPYERPPSPDLVLHPHAEAPGDSLARLVDFLATRGPTLGSKANTLASLGARLSHAEVLPQVVLSFDDWRSNPELYLAEMRERLGPAAVIVRSSCPDEDTNEGSNAGRFTSLLDVPLEREFVQAAMASVRDDYVAQGLKDADHVQILIQPMLTDVAMSGVVFTRHRSSDSPYYLVSYDDESGRTDSVTSGEAGRTVYLSRTLDSSQLGPWSGLIRMVRELEGFFPTVPLDLEFARTRSGRWILLQCRRLHVAQVPCSLEERAGVLLTELAARVERMHSPAPPLGGTRTVLSDMADWNPAEMLGERPSTLAYSLYRTLLTDEVWHRARASQGYTELSAAPLLVSVGRKAYIDTRASFNSFVPAGVSETTRGKLVDAWVARVAQTPELHDKVEFEVACTCFDLGTRERLASVPGLDASEVEEVAGALRQLTQRLVGQHVAAIAADTRQLDRLDALTEAVHVEYRSRTRFWESFQAAWLLVQHCQRYGTPPFARLARLGFVGKALVESLEAEGLVPAGFTAQLLAGVETVATDLARDLQRLGAGALPRDAFLERYGHLRMSTYDLTAARYDQLDPEVWRTAGASRAASAPPASPTERSLPACDTAAIDAALAAEGLDFGAEHLFAFLRDATVAREAAKFRFTRTLSDALEYLARAGEALDVSRAELQSLTLATLLRFRNPEDASPAKAATYLRERMREKRQERSVYDLIELPSVIRSGADLEQVTVLDARPNFVTRGRVTAEVVPLGADTRPGALELAGKIVAVRAADPGFDWIFSQGIVGLVTQYGGVASHMAIRCLEFDLPGAIGCGRRRFEEILGSRLALIDCAEGVLKRV